MRSICFFLLMALSTPFSYSEELIHPHGYWYGTDIENQHVFDSDLADALASFFAKEEAHTIVDFGCGMGSYVKTLSSFGFDCKGYDGNPDTYELSEGIANVLDLSQPFDLERRFDWVLSLEVGEHLPKIFESTFLHNLDRHAIQGIVLSWAVKGQGGFGHFNEQNNAYVKRAMRSLGYSNDVPVEKKLRTLASLGWFKDTIMVFRKIEK